MLIIGYLGWESHSFLSAISLVGRFFLTTMYTAIPNTDHIVNVPKVFSELLGWVVSGVIDVGNGGVSILVVGEFREFPEACIDVVDSPFTVPDLG